MREDHVSNDEAGAAWMERDRAEAYEGDDRPSLADVADSLDEPAEETLERIASQPRTVFDLPIAEWALGDGRPPLLGVDDADEEDHPF